MAEHLDNDELDRERVSAIALRLINLGWFRVGSERYAKESGTYGITTLTRRHVEVRGGRIRLAFRGKHSIHVRTELVDDELAAAMRELLGSPRRQPRLPLRVGGQDLQPHEPAAERLRQALPRAGIHRQGLPHLGRDAARRRGLRRARGEARLPGNGDRREALGRRRDAARGDSSSEIPRRSAGRRTSRRPSSISISRGERSRISGPAICASSARAIRGLDAEEQALLSLLRSWRIRQARAAA